MEALQINIQDYSYELPDDRIAYAPLEDRASSKMLIYKDGNIKDSIFHDFYEAIDLPSFIVLNETKVINARLFFQKESGAIIEIFCLEPESTYPDISSALQETESVQWKCLIGGRKKWKDLQSPIYIQLPNSDKVQAYWKADREQYSIIEFRWNTGAAFANILEAIGNIPLPPYIKRQVATADTERYQTVFAMHEGSIAAPTASLHLTEEILNNANNHNHRIGKITLHVGAGTFLPVKHDLIADHVMHEEWISIERPFLESWKKAIQEGKKTLAVGTTACRTLETVYWLGYKLKYNIPINWSGIGLEQWEVYKYMDDTHLSLLDALDTLIAYCEINNQSAIHTKTQLLILPGYIFKSIDILVTNFHQPHSTLLLLVAAFCGTDYKKIYQHALEQNYRFLSYGDGSLLYKKTDT